MKHLLVTVALLAGFAGCDGGAGTGVEDAPDGGFKTDVTPTGAVSIPTTPFPYAGTVASDYTSKGVTANLGRIQCGGGFEPGGSATSSTLTCWPATEVSGRGGICGVISKVVTYTTGGVTTSLSVCSASMDQYYMSAFDESHNGPLAGLFPYTPGTCAPMPACGTYAPGTLRVWSMDDPRYSYLGDPLSFGHAGSTGYICLPNIVPYVIPC